jgi:hypothetical protein
MVITIIIIIKCLKNSCPSRNEYNSKVTTLVYAPTCCTFVVLGDLIQLLFFFGLL